MTIERSRGVPGCPRVGAVRRNGRYLSRVSEGQGPGSAVWSYRVCPSTVNDLGARERMA